MHSISVYLITPLNRCSPDIGTRTIHSMGLKCRQHVGSTQERTNSVLAASRYPLPCPSVGSKTRADDIPKRKYDQNSMETVPHQE